MKLTVFLIFLGVMVGAPVGTGLATFIFADGHSYLSSNPKACVNCHIMQSQFDSWQTSSHKAIAACNDCHSNGSIIEKYSQKAVNGFLHSFAFTTGYFHEPIRIKGFNKNITQRSCLSCHESFVSSTHLTNEGLKNRFCTDCHKEVGHRKW